MHDHRAHEGAQKLYDLVKDVKVCMMTTLQADGTLHGRPMYGLESDEPGDLWFYTYLDTSKTTEIGRDGHVNLAYCNPDKQHYVSVLGRAEVVRDKDAMAAKWKESFRTWIPKGVDQPGLALIRVHPERGEYWDGPSSAAVQLYGYVKARVAGEPPTELTDNRKVDLR